MKITIDGKEPVVAASAYLTPGAFVIGQVEIGEKSSVWFNTVIRGDVDAISIGSETNIQDNCTIHADEGFPVRIGDRVTVGHNSVLHGCKIGSGAVIGMQSVLLNGCSVGEDAVIGAGSLVTSGTEIPPGTLALGRPAKVVKELTPEQIASGQELYKIYRDRSLVYQRDLPSK